MYRRLFQLRYRNKRYAILFALLGCLLGAVWLLSVYSELDFFSHEKEFEELIAETAERYSMDPLLLKAVIWRESRFRQNALGHKGEVGLMQIMPSAAALDWVAWNKLEAPPCRGMLFNPAVNVDVGAWYLSRALRKWKDYDNREALALCEYNAGPGKMKEWVPKSYDGDVISRIGIPSTKAYVSAIIGKYNEYDQKRKKN